MQQKDPEETFSTVSNNFERLFTFKMLE